MAVSTAAQLERLELIIHQHSPMPLIEVGPLENLLRELDIFI
jgi:hypothetical protein